MSNNYMMNSQMQSLDRELELLKRKREMIQHQWDIIEQEKNITMMMDSPRNNRPRNQNNSPRNQFQSPRHQFNSPSRNRNNSPRNRNISPWSQDDFSSPSMQHVQSFDPSYKTKNRGRKRKLEQNDCQHVKFDDRINKAKVSVVAKPKKPEDSHREEDYVLRADKTPSVQIQGRLELGLGSIVKEIRLSKIPAAKEVCAKYEYMKALKLEIRDRIQATMLGKHVSSLQVVVDNYRAVYPIETDKDLLAFVKTKIPASMDTFNKMVDKKIDNRLNAFIARLKQLDDEMIKEEAAKLKTQNYEMENKDDSQTPVVDQKKDTEAVDQEAGVAQEEENQGTTDVEEQKDETETTEPEAETIKGGVEPAEGEAVTTEGEPKTTEANNENKPDQSMEGSVVEENDKDNKKYDKASVVPNNKKKETKPANNDDSVEELELVLTKKQDEAIEKYINKKLWKILPQHKKTIIRFIHKDTDFLESIGRTRFREEIRETPGLLFVRILGKPNLPKKPEMQAFLEKFNPKVVKKHKYVHNLLFIGVKDMKEFKDLIAADGTVLSNMTLNVRSTTKTQDGLDNKELAGDNSEVKANESGEGNGSGETNEGGELDNGSMEVDDQSFSEDVGVTEVNKATEAELLIENNDVTE